MVNSAGGRDESMIPPLHVVHTVELAQAKPPDLDPATPWWVLGRRQVRGDGDLQVAGFRSGGMRWTLGNAEAGRLSRKRRVPAPYTRPHG